MITLEENEITVSMRDLNAYPSEGMFAVGGHFGARYSVPVVLLQQHPMKNSYFLTATLLCRRAV